VPSPRICTICGVRDLVGLPVRNELRPSEVLQTIHAVSTASGIVTLRLMVAHKQSKSQTPEGPPYPFEPDLYENFRLTHVAFHPIYGVGRLAGIKVAHSVRSWYVRLASAFPLAGYHQAVRVVSGPDKDFA
jgi:hypothetical protein